MALRRGETLCLGPKMCRPRLVGTLKWCLREDRLVLGSADSPAASEDLPRALKLLQAVMSAEDFSKCEKMVLPPSREERTKEREQLLWERVQSRNRLRKQEAGYVEQISKLDADAAQQRTMLQGVREQLEAVNDEVCALRALVRDISLWTTAGAAAAPGSTHSSFSAFAGPP